MTLLFSMLALFSLAFDGPIFKESIKDRVSYLNVCADSGCHE